MKRTELTGVLVLCSLLLWGCRAQDATVVQVTPGSSIGAVQLGASLAEVTEILGAPLLAEAELVADSLLRNEWSVGTGVLSVLLYQGEVIQIKVDGTAYETSAGVNRQSSVSEVRNAHPNMEASIMAHDMENMYLDDIAKGIAFTVREGRPDETTNSDGDVINVFVHYPGQEVIAIVHHHDSHH